MPSDDVSNQTQSFNLNSIETPNRPVPWKRYVVVVVLVAVAMGAGYGSMKLWQKLPQRASGVVKYEIQPLVPKAKSVDDVPEEFAMKGFLFASDGATTEEIVAINSLSDLARLPGSIELYYNRTQEGKIFFNSKYIGQENGRVIVEWKNFRMSFSDANVLLKDAGNGDDLNWNDMQNGNVVQVALGSDADGVINSMSLLVL